LFRSQNRVIETVVRRTHEWRPSPIRRHRRPFLPKQSPVTASPSTKNLFSANANHVSHGQPKSASLVSRRRHRKAVEPMLSPPDLPIGSKAGQPFRRGSCVRHHPSTRQRVATALPRHRPPRRSAPTERLPASTQATLPDSRISITRSTENGHREPPRHLDSFLH
jgi:hypothetical protein